MEYRTFVIPRHIHYGVGALNRLSTVTCQRALITTDRVIRELGIVERVESILRTNGAETRIFDQIEAEPSKETAWKAFHLAQEFKPDLFVGLGGGSCMDVGKVAWLLFEHPDLADMQLSESLQVAKSRELRRKARYVAIPTSSGSGSEGTVGAVIVDREANPPFKPVFTSEHLVPDVAILDPELTVSLPPTVTADCGYDALVHAIEPYVWEFQSDLVDALSVAAARTIFAWLPKAVSRRQRPAGQGKDAPGLTSGCNGDQQCQPYSCKRDRCPRTGTLDGCGFPHPPRPGQRLSAVPGVCLPLPDPQGSSRQPGRVTGYRGNRRPEQGRQPPGGPG